MTWIGTTDRHNSWFAESGTDEGIPTEKPAPGTLLPRGTLMIEARISPEDRPQTLLAFDRSFPWPGSFSLRVLPGGSVVLVEAQGSDTYSAVLPCPYRDRTDLVRLSYCWDAPKQTARLAIERPEPDSLHIVALDGARPMVLNDLREMLLQPALREMDRDVIQVALSDKVEPVGPMPSLTAHTPIMTHLGEKPVRKIRRGDLVLTDSGEYVPVLQTIRRVVPAHGGFRPVRLRAGYFGLTRDIVVAPDQRIVMRGSDVEYMFGREAVSVPARHLVNNFSAFLAHGPKTVAFYQLLLPGHEAIVAAGCPVESLYVGRIRRKPDKLAASILAVYGRAGLPEHAKPVWPVLKPFEAITLAGSRAA